MKVYILFEIDFGTWYIRDTFDSREKAESEQIELESLNTKEWIGYAVEEWEAK